MGEFIVAPGPNGAAKESAEQSSAETAAATALRIAAETALLITAAPVGWRISARRGRGSVARCAIAVGGADNHENDDQKPDANTEEAADVRSARSWVIRILRGIRRRGTVPLCGGAAFILVHPLLDEFYAGREPIVILLFFQERRSFYFEGHACPLR